MHGVPAHGRFRNEKGASRGQTQGGFKNLQICSRRRQSAHFSSITEISADCRRRLRFLETTLDGWPFAAFFVAGRIGHD